MAEQRGVLGACLGRPVDAVGLLAGLGGDVLDVARAGLHVAHGVQRQLGPRALPVQPRPAAAPRRPLEVPALVIPVGQLQHLHTHHATALSDDAYQALQEPE